MVQTLKSESRYLLWSFVSASHLESVLHEVPRDLTYNTLVKAYKQLTIHPAAHTMSNAYDLKNQTDMT